MVIDEEDNRKRLVLLKRECVGDGAKSCGGIFTRGSEKEVRRRGEFRRRAVAKGL